MDGNMWRGEHHPSRMKCIYREWIACAGWPHCFEVVVDLPLYKRRTPPPPILNWIGNGWARESSMLQRWYDWNQRGFCTEMRFQNRELHGRKGGSKMDMQAWTMNWFWNQSREKTYPHHVFSSVSQYKKQLSDVKRSTGQNNPSSLHRKFLGQGRAMGNVRRAGELYRSCDIQPPGDDLVLLFSSRFYSCCWHFVFSR